MGGGILQLKSQSAKISDNFHFRGGGYSLLQNRGKLYNFGPNFQPLQQAHASQIVSHMLRMWRLITQVRHIHRDIGTFELHNKLRFI